MNYERIVRRLRQRIFEYDDSGQGDKAQRILHRAISKKVAAYPPPSIDEFGATAADRRMLARHGICWGD